MGEEDGWGWAPTEPPLFIQREDHWRHFDNSVNAVSFGFIATAILISMFLVMAIFERFLQPARPPVLTPAGIPTAHHDIESQLGCNAKPFHPSCSSTMPANAREVSVLMPGEDIPTFIAYPAPAACPREPIHWPSHYHNSMLKFALNSDSNTSSRSI